MEFIQQKLSISLYFNHLRHDENSIFESVDNNQSGGNKKECIQLELQKMKEDESNVRGTHFNR